MPSEASFTFLIRKLFLDNGLDNYFILSPNK